MGASSDRRGAQQGSGSGLTRRESVACASPTEPFLARLADSPRQSEGAESMRPPRSGAAHSLYAGVRGNLLRPLPAPCVGMRSREQNAPRVLWNTGQIDRARFRFATAGLSVEASLRVEVPPQDLATESTGTASHWGQGRSSMDEGGCHRSHAVFHLIHRVPAQLGRSNSDHRVPISRQTTPVCARA